MSSTQNTYLHRVGITIVTHSTTYRVYRKLYLNVMRLLKLLPISIFTVVPCGGQVGALHGTTQVWHAL